MVIDSEISLAENCSHDNSQIRMYQVHEKVVMQQLTMDNLDPSEAQLMYSSH